MKKWLSGTAAIALAVAVSAPSLASAEEFVDFESLTDNNSVEGLGTVHPDLEITSINGNALVIETENDPGAAYGAPNPNGDPSQQDNCLEDDSGIRIDFNDAGDRAKGFADIESKNLQDPSDFDFTFSAGKVVQDFSLKVFDFGDFNPDTKTKHKVTLTAFDGSDAVVDEDVLEFASNGDVNPGGDTKTGLWLEGDACTATDDGKDEPGYVKLQVEGLNIAKVSLRFADDEEFGIDPNVGFDSIRFELQPPILKTITSGPDLPNSLDSSANLVMDGDFDDLITPCTDFDTVAAPGPIGAWDVGGAGVDYICTFWEDAGGDGNSIDLSAGDAGSISQTIPTDTSGDTNKLCQVNFSLAGNPDGGDPEKTVAVSVDNAAAESTNFSFNTAIAGASKADMKWEEKSFFFTPDAATTEVTFTSLNSSAFGPALDSVEAFCGDDAGDGEIDVVVEAAAQTESLHYDFTITVNTEETGLGDIHDVVPAEWDVWKVGGIPLEPDDTGTGWDTGDPPPPHDKPAYMEFPIDHTRLECGESDTVFNGFGEVKVERDGKAKDPKGKAGKIRGDACQSDTKLWWTPPEPSGIYSLRVDLQSRLKNTAQGLFSPTSCGALFLNEGAYISGTDFFTPPLIIAAVEDINEDGKIIRDGSGDEDEDGLTDIEEVRGMPMTDPCIADIDEDGLNDGEELANGTDPFDPDTDNDGLEDGQEVDLGTDPLVFTNQAALTPGWDEFPSGGGTLYWEDQGGSYFALFTITGGPASMSFTAGIDYFVDGSLLTCPTTSGTFDATGTFMREGNTACIGLVNFGTLTLDGSGDGAQSFTWTPQATNTDTVQFLLHDGSVYYRTGSAFAVGFEDLGFFP